MTTSLFTSTNTDLGTAGATATECTSGFVIVFPTAVHVSPPSRLTRTPSTSSPTHTVCASDGSTAMPVTRGMPTASHSATTSTGSWRQLCPPSSVRNTAAGVGVPVPAKTTDGSSGWTLILHTQ